jgi:hypothetical protein
LINAVVDSSGGPEPLGKIPKMEFKILLVAHSPLKSLVPSFADSTDSALFPFHSLVLE